MRVLTKHTVTSVLKVGIITALLASLMLMGVDLFKNLDTYTSMKVEIATVIKLTLLYFPEAFLMAIGPSFLFSVTYYLSSLNSENELISILNAGISHTKLIIPCIITGFFITLFCFGFNESVAIKSSSLKEELHNKVTYSGSQSGDNFAIALSDMQNGCMVYSEWYSDSEEVLYYVTYLETDKNGKLKQRIDAYSASWSKENENWTFRNCDVFIPTGSGNLFKEHMDEINLKLSYFTPQMFKNMSSSISKLSISEAAQYLKSIKSVNPEQYSSLATDFYSRVLGCLTPLILVIIAVYSNVRFKKNVLIFSIILSICISVIFYVVRILTIMMANQGVIKPYFGTLIPFFAVSLVAIFVSIFKEK